MPDRNPKWIWDEIILLLDVYFRIGPACASASHPEVIALSMLLRNSGFHRSPPDPERFRNPAGISMKLGNLLSLDSDYGGAGLAGASELDRLAWDRFSQNRDQCRLMADAIRSHLVSATHELSTCDPPAFHEGGILLVVHRCHERNRAIVELKKTRALERTGYLACEVCNFNFAAKYGSRGDAFIECHHKLPLSALEVTVETRLEDLALVCANCHRMIHRGVTLWSLDDVRQAIGQQSAVLSPGLPHHREP